jgi:uncharacterized protein YjdB
MKTNVAFLIIAFAALISVSCNQNGPEVLAVRLDKTKVEIVKGETIQLNAAVVPDQDVEITWYSADDKYVTVDENGLVTALALKTEGDEGSESVVPVSVYAKYKNGADEYKVTVLPLAPSRVEIVYDGQVVEIDPQESVALTASFFPEDADLKDITWSTNAANIAKVDSKTGVVTGVTAGFAVIRASYNEKIFDEIDVQVQVVNPESVAVDPADLTLKVGVKERINAVLTPANATGKLVWTSEDTSVAMIDSETGTVEALAPGQTKIRVQVGKVSGECKLTVE